MQKSNCYKPWIIWALSASFYFFMYILRVAPSALQKPLAESFSANATDMGFLMTSFYAPYLLMQMPAGALLDRLGARLILTLALISCSVGSYCFSFSQTLSFGITTRILLGLASSFAFVGTLTLARSWFSSKYLGIIVGVTQSLGMAGAACGQAFLVTLSQEYSWQTLHKIAALLFLILAVTIFVYVRNKPESLSSSISAKESFSSESTSIFHTIKTVCFNKQTWINAWYAALIFTPVAVYGEAWGGMFLEKVYGLSRIQASHAIGLLFVGWGIGGLFTGYLLDKWGRKPIMVLSAAYGVFFSLFLLYGPPLSCLETYALFFFFGATNGGLVASYTVSGELHPSYATGLSVGLTNMFSVFGTAASILVGKQLDLSFSTRPDPSFLTSGLPSYNVSDFINAMPVTVIAAAGAFILACFIKETHKKNEV